MSTLRFAGSRLTETHYHSVIKRQGRQDKGLEKLKEQAKQAAAVNLMNYVTSPICKTPLIDAISQTQRAHKNLIKEIKQHVEDWKKRHDIYETINYDVSHVQTNIERVLSGDTPIKLEKPERKPLALPAVAGKSH